MKKFEFSLQKVLSYREQVEDNIRNEHAGILKRISDQEQVLAGLELEARECSQKMDAEKQNGCKIYVVQMYEGYLSNKTKQIERAKKILAELELQKEKKLEELLSAKIDRSSIDKIKDKRKEEHSKAVMKADELFIEEFVSNLSAISRNQ